MDPIQGTSLTQLQATAAKRTLFGTREVISVAATRLGANQSTDIARLGNNLSAVDWTELVTMSHAEVSERIKYID